MSQVINTNPLDKKVVVKGHTELVHCLNELYLDMEQNPSEVFRDNEKWILQGWVEALEWTLGLNLNNNRSEDDKKNNE